MLAALGINKNLYMLDTKYDLEISYCHSIDGIWLPLPI